MESVEVILEGHSQRIKVLEREISMMREIQAEIRTMNESLVTLANEMKHVGEHLCEQERRLSEIENAPRKHAREIATAAVAALVGCAVTALISLFAA